MPQHKWHKEIKAWADGAEIEQIYTYANLNFDSWEQVKYPCWYEDDAQFRIKPQPKEPQYLSVEITEKGFTFNCAPLFDAGITGKFAIKLEVDDV
jgi:hypothetical protein